MEEKKRSRMNGTFRWTKLQTKDLLTIILDTVKANPEQFEKPTAQKFYDRITENSPNLCNIKWNIMRTKMRHLKTSFLSALRWKGQTGAGLLESGDVKSSEEYIKKICPFYEYLNGTFGRRVNIQPLAIYQFTEPILSLDNNTEEEFLEIDCERSSMSSLERPLVSPSFIVPTTYSENQVRPSSSYGSENCTHTNTTTPKRNLKRPQSFEKEKEENNFKLQKLQLEKEERIEMEKLKLEHERFKSVNN